MVAAGPGATSPIALREGVSLSELTAPSSRLLLVHRWYLAAADQGYAPAQYNLGLMRRQGRGVPQSDEEAERWFRRAADQGHAHARHKLGHQVRAPYLSLPPSSSSPTLFQLFLLSTSLCPSLPLCRRTPPVSVPPQLSHRAVV